MATIETRKTKAGKLSHYVKIRLKGHPQQSATFSEKPSARRWALSTEAAIREGRYFRNVEIEQRTVANMIDRYCKENLFHKKDAAKQYAQLMFWREHIGHYTLTEINAPIIAAVRDNELMHKNSNPLNGATINRYLAALSHVFTVAYREWEWISDNPMRKVNRKKESRGRVRFLTDDQRKRLLQACKNSKNPYLYTIVILAISTAARFSEIMNLTYERIDLDNGKALLEETKNGERKTLYLCGHALELLVKTKNVDSAGLLFPSRKNPSKPINFRGAWLRALENAEIKNYRWHDNRHEAASLLLRNKASLPEIAEILNHKSLNMVRRYAHLAESHTAGVVADMNRMVFG